MITIQEFLFSDTNATFEVNNERPAYNTCVHKQVFHYVLEVGRTKKYEEVKKKQQQEANKYEALKKGARSLTSGILALGIGWDILSWQKSTRKC
jgi:hypothetical protein